MTRFEYLDDPQESTSTGKPQKKPRFTSKIMAEQFKGQTIEHVESLYIRKETMKAASQATQYSEHDSVSELVEDLLLQWLIKKKSNT